MKTERWPEGALLKHLAEPAPVGWTDAAWAAFCTALAEGASYGRAGALIGKGKNVCIGVAHRRCLPKRDSWIGLGFGAGEKRDREARAREGRTAQNAAQAAQRAAERAAKAEDAARRAEVQAAIRAKAEAARQETLKQAAAVRAAAARPQTRRSEHGCSWPMGDPRSEGFRYCEAPDVVVGRSYCPAHCAIAYTRTAAEMDRNAQIMRNARTNPLAALRFGAPRAA